MTSAQGSQSRLSRSGIWKELKQNWWLWGSIAFAVLLVGSLVIFKDSLYDTAAHGLPFLAGKDPWHCSLAECPAACSIS